MPNSLYSASFDDRDDPKREVPAGTTPAADTAAPGKVADDENTPLVPGTEAASTASGVPAAEMGTSAAGDSRVEGADDEHGDDPGDDSESAGDDPQAAGDDTSDTKKPHPHADRGDGDDGDDVGTALTVTVMPTYRVPDADPDDVDVDSDVGVHPQASSIEEIPYEHGRVAHFVSVALAILGACGALLFNYGDKMAEIDDAGGIAGDRLARIRPVTATRVMVLLSTAARFTKETRNGVVSIDPPGQLLRAILECSSTAFLRLHRVVHLPMLLKNGTVIDQPGYDAGSATFYSPDRTLSRLSMLAAPTRADAEAAIARYKDLLVDALFVAPCHLSAAIAALITPLVRGAIDGCVPLFAIGAQVARIGKTELVNFVSLLLTGLPARIQPPCGNTELEKRITVHVRDGDAMLAFDNGDKQLGGRVLEAALTARYWVGRLLGKSEKFVGPMTLTMYATGNHLTFHNDMLGRVVIVELGTLLEWPGERPLHRPDAQAWLLQHRGQLIVDAITICRAYMAAGLPDLGLKPMRGFDAWSRVVRSALVWAGLPDPMQDIATVRAEADPESEAHGIALQQLEQLYPDGRHFTVNALHVLLARVGRTFGDQDVVGPLRDALDVFFGRKSTSFNALQLGHTFKRLSGKTAGGLRLYACGKGKNGREYNVDRVK